MNPNYKRLSRYLRASEEDYSSMLKDHGIDISKVKDKLKGGKADKKQPTDFPLDQLEKGLKVEKEHTDDPYTALEISMDHLTEDRKYYTKLNKMEKSGRVKISSLREDAANEKYGKNIKKNKELLYKAYRAIEREFFSEDEDRSNHANQAMDDIKKGIMDEDEILFWYQKQLEYEDLTD